MKECCPFCGFDYQPAERRLAITVAQPDQAPALDAPHDALASTNAASPWLRASQR